MLYDPKNELSDEQLKKLSEDDFFAYLDAKADYLKGFTVPLDQYHTKKYASVAAGGTLSTKQLREAKKIGFIC